MHPHFSERYRRYLSISASDEDQGVLSPAVFNPQPRFAVPSFFPYLILVNHLGLPQVESNHLPSLLHLLRALHQPRPYKSVRTQSWREKEIAPMKK